MDSKSPEFIEFIVPEMENPVDANPSTSAANSQPDRAHELTKKFLRGEMTFADYSDEWYSQHDDEDPDEATPNQKLIKVGNENVKKRRAFSRLSPALLGLMGEANLRFARGEKEVAEKICHEIIRQVPTAAEPYQTLANLYENDPDKSIQFSLLAAHLSRTEPDEWMRLADLSKQRGDIKQEMICHTEAIKSRPYDLSLHLGRLELMKSLEEKGHTLSSLNISYSRSYHKIVTSLHPSQGEHIMKYARMAAGLYHKNNETERAFEVLAAAYSKCSFMFTVEDINLYLELLIGQKQYQKAIEVLIVNSGIEIEAEVESVQEGKEVVENTKYLSYRIPPDLPIDLKVKLLICFIHLRAKEVTHLLLNDFLKNDIEKIGDLCMDVEEALSVEGEYELSIYILEPLVKSKNFSLGAVWLKYAECLLNLGREDEAIQAFKMVVELAPQHAEAHRKLFSLFEKRGALELALEALQQDYRLIISTALLYEQCCTLMKYQQHEKLLEAGEVLLSRNFVRFRHPEELKMARLNRGPLDAIKAFRSQRGENIYNIDDIHFDEEETFKLTGEEEWELFKELINIAFNFKDYAAMQRLSFGALVSKELMPRRKEIDFYCIQSALLGKNYDNALPIIREYLFKTPDLPRLWNLFDLTNNNAEDRVTSKFLYRFFKKLCVDEKIMNLLLGNNFLQSGRYLECMRYYLELYESGKDPYVCLVLGIVIVTMACQRTVDKHNDLVLQGIAYFLEYKQLRNCEEEIYYNLARAFHMLGINNLAVEFYHKVLNVDETICEEHEFISLKKEAAYNMYIMHKQHSPHIARMYLQKYLVV